MATGYLHLCSSALPGSLHSTADCHNVWLLISVWRTGDLQICWALRVFRGLQLIFSLICLLFFPSFWFYHLITQKLLLACLWHVCWVFPILGCRIRCFHLRLIEGLNCSSFLIYKEMWDKEFWQWTQPMLDVWFSIFKSIKVALLLVSISNENSKN